MRRPILAAETVTNISLPSVLYSRDVLSAVSCQARLPWRKKKVFEYFFTLVNAFACRRCTNSYLNPPAQLGILSCLSFDYVWGSFSRLWCVIPRVSKKFCNNSECSFHGTEDTERILIRDLTILVPRENPKWQFQQKYLKWWKNLLREVIDSSRPWCQQV